MPLAYFSIQLSHVYTRDMGLSGQLARGRTHGVSSQGTPCHAAKQCNVAAAAFALRMRMRMRILSRIEAVLDRFRPIDPVERGDDYRRWVGRHSTGRLRNATEIDRIRSHCVP
jgi:hypothetical protein